MPLALEVVRLESGEGLRLVREELGRSAANRLKTPLEWQGEMMILDMHHKHTALMQKTQWVLCSMERITLRMGAGREAPGRACSQHHCQTIAHGRNFLSREGHDREGHVEPAKTEGQLRKNAVPFVDTVGELKNAANSKAPARP